jgi:hypothetical protein
MQVPFNSRKNPICTAVRKSRDRNIYFCHWRRAYGEESNYFEFSHLTGIFHAVFTFEIKENFMPSQQFSV